MRGQDGKIWYEYEVEGDEGKLYNEGRTAVRQQCAAVL